MNYLILAVDLCDSSAHHFMKDAVDPTFDSSALLHLYHSAFHGHHPYMVLWPIKRLSFLKDLSSDKPEQDIWVVIRAKKKYYPIFSWVLSLSHSSDDQHERTFSSYVRIQVVVLKTCLGRWTIGRSGERGSGISVLPARYDDDDFTLIRCMWGYLFYYVRKWLQGLQCSSKLYWALF